MMKSFMYDLRYYLRTKDRQFYNRISQAIDIISNALERSCNPIVAWSGGKDSTAMLHLVWKLKPDIKIYHLDSGYSFKDVSDFIRKLYKQWNLNLHIEQQRIDYLELCKEFGLPHTRNEQLQKKVVEKLKKRSSDEYYIANNHDLVFIGLRAEESIGRKWVRRASAKNGYIIHGKSYNRCYPKINLIAIDILSYHEKLQIPCAEIYNKENYGFTRETLRNTGWISTDGEATGYLMWLRYNYPEYYNRLRNLFPSQVNT